MSPGATAPGDAAAPYRDSYEHLADELLGLDLRIALRLAALPPRTETGPLYVSRDEVERLLERGGEEVDPAEVAPEAAAALAAHEETIERRVSASAEHGVALSLPRLGRLFALSPAEVSAVLVGLAPELDRKYDRLYAYLQDDITRKKPSVDLVLDLLCVSRFERWRARALLAEEATLLRFGILETTEDPQSPSGSSGLARFLKLDARILSFLLEETVLDSRLAGIAELDEAPAPLAEVPVDEAAKGELRCLMGHVFSRDRETPGRLVLHLHGPRGVGKRELAAGLCADLGCPLLVLDAALLPNDEVEAAVLLRRALREGLLLQAALLVERAGALFTDGPGVAHRKLLARDLAEYGGLTVLAAEKRLPWDELARSTAAWNVTWQTLEVPSPAVDLRERVWHQALAGLDVSAPNDAPRRLAERFRLTPGQIRDACRDVESRCRMSEPQRSARLDDLSAACRKASSPRLAELAVKIEPRYGWEDIVLPADKLDHLREICAQIHHRHRVFGEWGFDRKLSRGKGLSALFSGPPGTGKTMAAEVLAGELGLELYKIDLSGVVSKYIGETEKNLARLFREAESSNAILFFDEADALFGKRTEVRDAHDRYANVETSYLLQKMEEYEGMTILATNFQQNVDAAFLRRIRFLVELPFPDEERRREIWSRLFPEETPKSGEIDYTFLAQNLKIAGGNIRNVALNAAFLAAQDGGVVRMKHIFQGARREYGKIGKLWDEKISKESTPNVREKT